MTSALLVVSRMVGMLVGISALTTIGLRRYYAVESGIPPVTEVCPAGKTQCAAYTRLIEQAGIEQLQAIFLGAAICAVIAAVAAVLCFGEVRTLADLTPVRRPPPTRFVPVTSEAFDDLLAANKKFAESFDLAGFDGVAHAGIAIVTCMDSRIDPLGMLGLVSR